MHISTLLNKLGSLNTDLVQQLAKHTDALNSLSEQTDKETLKMIIKEWKICEGQVSKEKFAESVAYRYDYDVDVEQITSLLELSNLDVDEDTINNLKDLTNKPTNGAAKLTNEEAAAIILILKNKTDITREEILKLSDLFSITESSIYNMMKGLQRRQLAEDLGLI